MTLLEQQISHYLQQQEAAKRVLVAIKKARKREELPSALNVADSPLARADSKFRQELMPAAAAPLPVAP